MRNITDFIILGKLVKHKNGNQFRHRVKLVKKKPLAEPQSPKHDNIWYLKKENFVLYEVIAQEFFRLLLPHQPKTRQVVNNDLPADSGSNALDDLPTILDYVISKQIPGYRSLHTFSLTEFYEGVKAGTYSGLGEVLVIALFLNEFDLKRDNLCINDKNQVIKIDGGWSMASFHKDEGPSPGHTFIAGKNFSITAKDIQHLPFISDYQPFHWLDVRMEGVQLRDTPNANEIALSQDPRFRLEVNSAMLKILTLPPELFIKFIKRYSKHYDSDEQQEIIETMLERRQQLEKAALANDRFCEYLKNRDSKKQLKEFIKQLEDFKTTGKKTLHVRKHKKAIKHLFKRLRKQAKHHIHRIEKHKMTLAGQSCTLFAPKHYQQLKEEKPMGMLRV